VLHYYRSSIIIYTNITFHIKALHYNIIMASRTSRKKNKGKERKAKKVETERVRVRNQWMGWATGDGITCDHGCAILWTVDGTTSNFFDEFFNRGTFSFDDVANMLQGNNGDLLNDKRFREIAVGIFIRIGTNMMLSGGNNNFLWAQRIEKTIILLENYYNGMDSLDIALHCRVAARKFRDLDTTSCGSAKRDVLKFFSKRAPCSCLMEMHQTARGVFPKKGRCYRCEQEKDRVALSVCSRCMIMQYCSRGCQVADWSHHKGDCDLYVYAQKQQMSIVRAEMKAEAKDEESDIS